MRQCFFKRVTWCYCSVRLRTFHLSSAHFTSLLNQHFKLLQLWINRTCYHSSQSLFTWRSLEHAVMTAVISLCIWHWQFNEDSVTLQRAWFSPRNKTYLNNRSDEKLILMKNARFNLNHVLQLCLFTAMVQHQSAFVVLRWSCQLHMPLRCRTIHTCTQSTWWKGRTISCVSRLWTCD